MYVWLFLCLVVGFVVPIDVSPKVAVIPIVLGVAMAWHSEMDISSSGVLVSVVCIVLNAVKVVINSEMLTGEHKVGQLEIYTTVERQQHCKCSWFSFRGKY